MNLKRKILAGVIAIAGTNHALGQPEVIPEYQKNSTWYIEGQKNVKAKNKLARKVGAAKNVILFVGDGMGVSTVTAARILEGQLKGMQGEENNLSFDMFPWTGLAKTYNVDAQTPDSAGTMTAMMTGVKTDVGVIGVDARVERGDCSSVPGTELTTALELAEMARKATGIVSTARITHATPAAAYAKSADRNWEDDSDMPQEAIDQGCIDIATQLVEFENLLEARYPWADVDGIDVIFGGGRRHFLPKDETYNIEKPFGSGAEGDRTDGRDLTAEWVEAHPYGKFVVDQAGFDAIRPRKHSQVLGLFNESHMQYEADRKNDILGEPSIVEMTTKAIDILKHNENGYFLTVESGRIDHAHHAGNASGALVDTIVFAQAIEAAVKKANMKDTLIIVTADHSHVFTIAGYAKRGNNILGKVVAVGNTEPQLAADGLPYTTLGYTNGRGFADFGLETDSDAIYGSDPFSGRVDLTSIDTQQQGYHQETLVPLSSETHAGEDIAIYGKGPGAHGVLGTNEQNVVFHVMNQAGNLVQAALKGQSEKGRFGAEPASDVATLTDF